VVNLSKKVSYLVSTDTGEVTNEINEGDRVRITRKESLEYLSQFQEWRIEHFYKGHVDELRKLTDLTTNEKAFLFSIATYVGYEDCCLKHPNGNDITPDDLLRITGLCKSILYDTINSLSKKDIIYKGNNSRNRQYFINPWLFCKGNRINRVLKTMFKNYRIRVLGGIKWDDV